MDEMESPFPGMDPYLERFWNDVHGKMIAYIADALNEQLPSQFRAGLQARVIITDPDESKTTAKYPDVAVIDWPVGETGGVATVHSHRVVVRSPAIVRFQSEPLTQYSIEITDARFGEKVVTAIEVLSPENKRPGDGMVQFRRKQDEYRAAKVNRVNIDLLREGRRMFEFPEGRLDPELRKPYFVSVYRSQKPNQSEVYAIDLRDPLPLIGIPLHAGDPDVELELQPLFSRVYRNGRFPINYNKPCDPPLDSEMAEWAAQTLAARFKK
jgi:hypothetical protein